MSAQSPEPASSVFRVGDWEVLPQEGCVRCEGRVKRLQPRVMQLLCLLARRPGLIVPVDEIVDSVWSPMVVGPENVKVAIRKLRVALGDDTGTPRYVETHARRGYRLIARVTTGSAARAGPPPTERTVNLRIPPFAMISGADTAEFVARFVHGDLVSLFARHARLLVQVEEGETDVDYVLCGEVVLIGGETTLLFRLVACASGSVLWADRIALPADAAEFRGHRIIGLLVKEFIEVDSWGALARGAQAQLAFREYASGMRAWQQLGLGAGGNPVVVGDHWRRAIALAPNLWPAHVQLVIHYSNRYEQGESLDAFISMAHQAARELIRLVARLPNRLVQFSWEHPVATVLYRLDLDLVLADRCMQRARALGWPPGQVDAERGVLAAAMGASNEAIRFCEGGLAAGAGINDTLARWTIGEALIAEGSYAAAVGVLEDALAVTIDGSTLRTTILRSLVLAQALCGRRRDAEASMARALGGVRDQSSGFAAALALLGRSTEARRCLANAEAKANRPQKGGFRELWPIFLGHVFLGDESGALHWLDRVIENREVYRLGHIRCAHYLDALRPESGFRAIVERLDDRERAGSPLREVVLAALGP